MVIQGSVNLILMYGDPKDRHRSDLEEIVRATGRAAALTHQLLAFGRSRSSVLQGDQSECSAGGPPQDDEGALSARTSNCARSFPLLCGSYRLIPGSLNRWS